MANESLWHRLIAKIEELEPPLQDAFFASVWTLRDDADVIELLNLIERGDIEGALSLIFAGDAAGSRFDALAAAEGESFHNVIIDSLSAPADAVLGRGLGIEGQLIGRIANTAFANHITEDIASRITGIDQETRDGVRAYLERALAGGRNPLNTLTELVGRVQSDGSRLGGIIGLRPDQAQAVYNFRLALENRELSVLDRALRDKRFDPSMIANAEHLSNGQLNPNFKPLSAGQINDLVTRYEGRQLAYRGQLIARTEAMHAQRLGNRMAWSTAIDEGAVERDRLKRTWVTAHDGKVRPAHRQMEGVTVGFDQLFNTPDEGPILNPSAPNCRCVIWTQPSL